MIEFDTSERYHKIKRKSIKSTYTVEFKSDLAACTRN